MHCADHESACGDKTTSGHKNRNIQNDYIERTGNGPPWRREDQCLVRASGVSGCRARRGRVVWERKNDMSDEQSQNAACESVGKRSY